MPHKPFIPQSQSQKVRHLIWQWWDYEKNNGLTTLQSEDFYTEKTDNFMAWVREQFPETRLQDTTDTSGHALEFCPFYKAWLTTKQKRSDMFNAGNNQLCPNCKRI